MYSSSNILSTQSFIITSLQSLTGVGVFFQDFAYPFVVGNKWFEIAKGLNPESFARIVVLFRAPKMVVDLLFLARTIWMKFTDI